MPSRFERTGIPSILNAINVGAVVLDASLTLLHANKLAEKFAELENGFRLTERGVTPYVAAERSMVFSELELVVADPSKQRVVPISAEGVVTYYVSIANIARLGEPAENSSGVLQLIYSIKPETDYGEMLQSLFKLSRNESRLTNLLCHGVTLSDAATQMGITYSTARSYLRNVFRKTSVTRQADLLRLVSTMPMGRVD